MLRTLMLQPENRLIKLCQAQEWDKVIQTAKSSPKEAKPSSSAYRGISNTSLIVAIRNNAPVRVIRALIKANTDQLMQVRHHRHGNALHEAIKYKASVDVLLFLIETIIRLEKESTWMYRGELRPVHIECAASSSDSDSSARTFKSSMCKSDIYHHGHTNQKKNCIYKAHGSGNVTNPAASASLASPSLASPSAISTNHRIHTHCTLFNQNDSLGRTPLHCLVDRFSKQRLQSTNFIKALILLITAFPPAVGKVDTEGFTPLDICLISNAYDGDLQRVNINNMNTGMEVEIKIFNIVKIMIDAFPSAAAPRINSIQAKATRDVLVESNIKSSLMDSWHGMNNGSESISHNTLSHALMNGRHLSIIELLIGASSKATNRSWHTGLLQDWEEYDATNKNTATTNRHCNDNVTSDHGHGHDQNDSCMAIISKNFEVPLHIAITMKASSDIVAHLVEVKPEAATIHDRYLLSPICWAWIRYVIDVIEPRRRREEELMVTVGPTALAEAASAANSRLGQPVAVKPSRRRFIPTNFLIAHEEITKKSFEEAKGIINMVSATCNTCYMQQVEARERIEHRHLWFNLSTLLPNVATVTSRYDQNNNRLFGQQSKDGCHSQFVEHWNPVHAAAYVKCSKGVLLSTIKNSPHSVKEIDQYGNLPLHYAAARNGYSKSIPVGANNTPEELIESSNVFELIALYPNSTKVKNHVGQLPIHIAIEEEKNRCSEYENNFKKRLLNASSTGSDDNKRQKLFMTTKNIEESPLMCLIKANVDSLEERDNITLLYPFMQIAAGNDNFVSLDFVFVMLQLNPNLVKTK